MRAKITLLTLLLILSGASALTVNINNIETSLNSHDNLTINYNIILDSQEETNYVISLTSPTKEFIILNNTESITSKTETLNYNVTSISSGTYTLNLKVKNPSLNTNVNSGKNITIQKDIGFKTSIPETIHLTSEQTSIQTIITNAGNTDLSISAYFKNALSEITIIPQSFQMKHGENKTLELKINKPENDYNTTLVIMLITPDEEIKREYPIQVIIPIINLTLNDVSVTESNNESTINAQIINTGNMNVNATIDIRTFEILSGYQTIKEEITINKGQETNYTKTIPKTSITSVTVTYNDGTSNQTLTKELNVLNKIPLDIKLSPERLTLLGILALVLIIIVYFKFFNKKTARP